MEKFIDLVGQILFVSAFLSPFIIIPCVWRFIDGSKMIRIAIGLILSFVVACLLCVISMAICFRNGLGPG